MLGRTAPAIVMALTLAVAACSGSQPGTEEEAGAASDVPAWVGDMAEMANAIEAQPAAADSIIQANGMSRAAFDSLLYQIAADPVLTQAYEAQRSK